MNKGKKEYTNGEITVHWYPEKCIHAARCVTRSPRVFNVNRRPWVDMSGAATEEIKATVESCPSGALTWTQN